MGQGEQYQEINSTVNVSKKLNLTWREHSNGKSKIPYVYNLDAFYGFTMEFELYSGIIWL